MAKQRMVCDQHYRLRGPLGEGCFPLSAGQNRVGSAEGNDLVIPVPGVSRRHALLSREDGQILLEDLGSHNGTFVNSKRVVRLMVAAGDRIRFGPVQMELEQVDAGDTELGLDLALPPVSEPRFEAKDSTETVIAPALAWLMAPENSRLIFPQGFVPGCSHGALCLYRDLQPLAGSDLPVLIEGETGVGKEFVARTLHLSSPRRRGRFVAVNCAAIPTELLEAELFGIAEGVATGVRQRPGKFLAAAGGTLLLDEIGEMQPVIQAKLLRALQEKEIEPLGARPMPIDVRVLAATNMDLWEMLESGRFRRDLYYRIAGAVVRVPPLRERREDIPPLIQHFIRRVACDTDRYILGVTVKALEILTEYSWPGNVRELEHEIERLSYACDERDQIIDSQMLAKRLAGHQLEVAECPEVTADHAGANGGVVPRQSEEEPQVGPTSLCLVHHVQETERRIIGLALERSGGSQRHAARLLEIGRSTLARKLRKLGIEARGDDLEH